MKLLGLLPSSERSGPWVSPGCCSLHSECVWREPCFILCLLSLENLPQAHRDANSMCWRKVTRDSPGFWRWFLAFAKLLALLVLASLEAEVINLARKVLRIELTPEEENNIGLFALPPFLVSKCLNPPQTLSMSLSKQTPH